MRAEERRQAIEDILRKSAQPISAGTLAARFSVSRQIIVGDIALLRAAGRISPPRPGAMSSSIPPRAWCGRSLYSMTPPVWRRS